MKTLATLLLLLAALAGRAATLVVFFPPNPPEDRVLQYKIYTTTNLYLPFQLAATLTNPVPTNATLTLVDGSVITVTNHIVWTTNTAPTTFFAYATAVNFWGIPGRTSNVASCPGIPAEVQPPGIGK